MVTPGWQAVINSLKDGCSTNENGSIYSVTTFNTSPVSSLSVIEVRLPFGLDHDSFACYILYCDGGAGCFSARVATEPLNSFKFSRVNALQIKKKVCVVVEVHKHLSHKSHCVS